MKLFEPVTGEVLSTKAYAVIFFSLLLLTLATALLSSIDLGPFHTPVGLVIAGAKAVLVALFFMGLIHSTRLTQLVVGGGLLWLFILIFLTLDDYITRGWLGFPGK
jgi:cytochrome c oxidase subunit 4